MKRWNSTKCFANLFMVDAFVVFVGMVGYFLAEIAGYEKLSFAGIATLFIGIGAIVANGIISTLVVDKEIYFEE